MEKFRVHGMVHLFVHENLTQRRKRLFWLSKQKAKEVGYNYFWTHNGQIFVHENEESEQIFIRTESDLDKL